MGSLPQSSDSSAYPPFKNQGNLDGLKEVQITPCLGSEYKDVDVTEWLKAPNSDDILRDLVITSEYLPFDRPKSIYNWEADHWSHSRRAWRGLLPQPE